MVANWVYRISDGVFIQGGYFDPTFDPTTHGVVRLPEGVSPNVRLERWDGDKGKRAATPAEIAAYDTDRVDAEADASLNTKAMRALAQATFELKTTAWTAQQFKDRIRAIFKSL